MDKSKIRNFSIIAHVDHGKSTLADRILELSGAVNEREKKEQILDTMDLERERGITIKLNAVQILYKYKDDEYILNLIDTPGHVDFTYEVSRSLAASDGVILLIDATQGVEPQTIANMYLALENNLKILPVINKIDSPLADVKKTKEEIEKTLGLSVDNVPLISAKNGTNIEEVIKLIIDEIPYPSNASDEKDLQALVFDSYFDSYKGIIIFVRIMQGKIKKGDHLKFLQNFHQFEVVSVGVNTPFEKEKKELVAGETGWIVTNEKDIHSFAVGDTLTYKDAKNVSSIKGYKESKPMVFSGFYPIDTNKYLLLEEALGKIALSDSSLTFEKETSKALGFGFRIGFLGLLHLEIIQQRIEREFKIDIISTAPSVVYHVFLRNGKMKIVQNPSDFPDKSIIERIEEPYVKLSLYSPQEYIGKLMEYVHKRRGNYLNLEILSERMNSLIYEIPLSEIVFDFFDSVKSLSKGYASFDYQEIGYRVSNLSKLDILIAGEKIDALSLVVEKDSAYYIGRELTKKLKETIPKQNFEVAIQASINGKIIARETLKAYRKDVTGYLYGGDVSRKKKLLEKQKKGKKKMKQIGKVSIPQETFISILKKDNNK